MRGVALGFIVGPSAATLLAGANLPFALVVLVLAVLGLLGWLVLRGRRRAGLHAWTEAACPACLIATALQRADQPGAATEA